MNDQVSMMNKARMNPPPPTAMMGAMNQPPHQMMNPQVSQPPARPPQMLMNPPQSQQQQAQMMNRGYGMWGHLPPSQPMDLQLKYQNPNPMKTQGGGGGGFGKPPSKHQLGVRNNWKGKKMNKLDKRNDLGRRMENPMSMAGGSSGSGTMGMSGNIVGSGGGGFNPPSLKELQYQNRVKTRRYFQKNYYNNNNNKNNNRGKFAPRNTTSFIIRAKKSGGIAELVSPCPVTPAVLPTPVFSPSREVLVDMAKEEWGVDGYGSMKGLIRLRSPGGEEEEEDEGGSSESDVEEHVEVERRLDHDLSRFEMIYPSYGTVGGMEHNNVLENRVDDQDSHIAQLEEENLILKERLFLMERELGDLKRRLQSLERHSHDGDYGHEEVVENMSENESDSREPHSMEDNNEELGDENLDAKGNKEDNTLALGVSRDALFEENHKEEQEEIKDSAVKLNKQNTTKDGNKDVAVGGVEEENKDETMSIEVVQITQIGNDGNNNVEDEVSTYKEEEDEVSQNEKGV